MKSCFLIACFLILACLLAGCTVNGPVTPTQAAADIATAENFRASIDEANAVIQSLAITGVVNATEAKTAAAVTVDADKLIDAYEAQVKTGTVNDAAFIPQIIADAGQLAIIIAAHPPAAAKITPAHLATLRHAEAQAK